MRQSHRAGEQLFVDSAGQGISLVNVQTGEVQEAALFLAGLGASPSPEVEAPWTQRLPDGLGSHGRTLAALGGGPDVGGPDNLKAAVTRAHRDEPALKRTDAARAHHDGGAVIPARAAQPRDKAKGAVGVHGVERWMGARLRPHTCCALAAVHATIGALLPTLHARPCKKLPGSRQSLFETRDRPALQPLPAQPYADAEGQRARVNMEAPVEVAGHSYAGP
jgi:transposase